MSVVKVIMHYKICKIFKVAYSTLLVSKNSYTPILRLLVNHARISQKTLTEWGSITLLLVSSLAGLDSTVQVSN